MACACGFEHTITISNDGSVHSFGRNFEGELGLGNTENAYNGELGLRHNKNVSFPTPIPNLPKINQVSCGGYFTVCVDCEGFIWSFGNNYSGQLGTGNTTHFNIPQKLLDIPLAQSVSCGFEHTLILTNDSNLWSCGSNNFGQLFPHANISPLSF